MLIHLYDYDIRYFPKRYDHLARWLYLNDLDPRSVLARDVIEITDGVIRYLECARDSGGKKLTRLTSDSLDYVMKPGEKVLKHPFLPLVSESDKRVHLSEWHPGNAERNQALISWLETNGVSVKGMLESTQLIWRGGKVEYLRVNRDAQGNIVYEGDYPSLSIETFTPSTPFPDVP